MRKIIYLLLLCLLLVSCEMPTESTDEDVKKEPYVTNVRIEDMRLSWEGYDPYNKYEISYYTSIDTTPKIITVKTLYYDFQPLELDKTDSDVFDLYFKVKPIMGSMYSTTVICHYNRKDNPIAPSKLKIDENILTFELVKYATDYELSINDQTEIISSNSIDLSSYVTEYGTYNVTLKTLANDYYKTDSLITTISYNYRDLTEGVVLIDHDFTKDSSLPEGYSSKSFNKYADGTVKLTTNGDYIQTPKFENEMSVQASVEICGKNTSGTAVVTFYAYNSEGKMVESIPLEMEIPTKTTTLKATFSADYITQVKFEYTTKASGNIGLAKMTVVSKKSNDGLIKIRIIDPKTTYKIGDSFSPDGQLELNYFSGKTEYVSINSLDPKDYILESFNTTTIGNKTAKITYMNKEVTFDYQVQFPYKSLYEYVQNVNIYYINETDNQDLVLLIMVNGKNDSISLLIDFNNNLPYDAVTEIKQFASAYTDNFDYYYSNHITGDTAIIKNNTYQLAADVNISIGNEYMILNANGYKMVYNYANTFNGYTNLKKVDFLLSNSTLSTNILTALNPEVVILKEGSLNDIYQDAVNAYTYNDNIYIYDTTLCGTINLEITQNQYSFDGETIKELSATSAWSNLPESNGLHHASMKNYIYRKEYYGDLSDYSGNTLRTKLSLLVTETHTKLISYGEARYTAIYTDADPLNPGNIILLYSGDSIKGNWDNGITWNREHVWPKSLSGGLYPDISASQANAGSDLHQLKPAYSSINSSRNNKPYGSANTATYFCPRAEVQGDIARIIFYMSIRYSMDIIGLNVASSIELLVNWHNQDKVDSFERNRNMVVQSYQGNYNPFIDNPWMVDAIW